MSANYIIPLENEAEADLAEHLLREVSNATDDTPGWLIEASGVTGALDTLRESIEAFWSERRPLDSE